MKKLYIALGVSLLVLTGCGSNTPDTTPSNQGLEKTVDNVDIVKLTESEIGDLKKSVNDEATKDPAGDAILVGNDLSFILAGSSSCPPELEKVKVDTTTLTIHLESPDLDKPCTADIRYFGWSTVVDENQAKTLKKAVLESGETSVPMSFTRTDKPE